MRSNRSIVLSLAAMLLTCGSARAAILYQTDFESPTFSAGVIDGQAGWESSSNAVVESPFAQSGTQAVHFDVTDYQHEWSDIPLSESFAGKVFTFEVDFLHSGSNPNVQSTLSVFGDGSPQFIAQIGYANGELFIGNTNQKGTTIAAVNDVWHHLVLTLDFTDNMMSGTADGQSLGAIPINNATVPAHMTEVDLATYGGTDTSDYFDNLVVSSVSVPEPQLAGVLGAVALAGSRRRSRPRP